MNKALRFAEVVVKEFGLSIAVCTSQEMSNAIDVFPFRLDPPIVLVERPESKATTSDDRVAEEIAIERKVEARVEDFGGTFAGT